MRRAPCAGWRVGTARGTEPAHYGMMTLRCTWSARYDAAASQLHGGVHQDNALPRWATMRADVPRNPLGRGDTQGWRDWRGVQLVPLEPQSQGGLHCDPGFSPKLVVKYLRRVRMRVRVPTHCQGGEVVANEGVSKGVCAG